MVITFWTESKYNIAFCHLLSNSISLPEPQTPPSSHTAQSEQESGKWPAVETDPIWPACGNHWLCKLSHLHWNEHQNEFCTVGGRHLSQLQLQNGTLMYNNWILPSTDWRILQASSIPRDKGSSCNDRSRFPFSTFKQLIRQMFLRTSWMPRISQIFLRVIYLVKWGQTYIPVLNINKSSGGRGITFLLFSNMAVPSQLFNFSFWWLMELTQTITLRKSGTFMNYFSL